jgi:hypothetical protein
MEKWGYGLWVILHDIGGIPHIIINDYKWLYIPLNGDIILYRIIHCGLSIIVELLLSHFILVIPP